MAETGAKIRASLESLSGRLCSLEAEVRSLRTETYVFLTNIPPGRHTDAPTPSDRWAIERADADLLFLASILSSTRASLVQVEKIRQRRAHQDRAWAQALILAAQGESRG